MQDESFESKSEESPLRPTHTANSPPLRSADDTTFQKIKHVIYDFFLILHQILEDYGSRIFLFTIAFISITLQANGIGFLYLSISVLFLILELKTNWNYIWISYGLVSLMVIGGQIFYLVSQDDDGNTEDTANWLGFALLSPDSVSVFVINSLIFIFSILFGIFISTTNKVMKDKEYVQARKKFAPVLHRKLEIMENQEAFGRFSMLVQAHEARPSDLEQLRNEFKALRVRYYYRKISRFFERFCHRHGYELCLLCLLFLAIYEVNALSIVYTLVAAYFSFSTVYFFKESHAVKLKFLRYQWRFFAFLMALDLLRQYFFGIWFPLSWNIHKPFANQTFVCDPNAENVYSAISYFADKDDYQVCIEGWRNWLTLDTVVNGRLFFYFFTIYFFILYDRYFLSIKTKRDRFEEGDDLDFTNPNNRDIFDHLRFFYYCHFYTIPVLLFIGISMKLNISGRTDLISLLYLILGLFLLFNYKKLLRERNRVWRIVEVINIVILLAIIVFQVPIVPCPADIPGRSFISLSECAWIQDTVDNNAAESMSNSNALYAILKIIGLYKISGLAIDDSVYKEVLLVLFFSLAIVQRKIWHHPYIKAYVIPFYEKKDKYNHQIAAKYVERVHLDRIRAHRGVLIDKELAINTERKIENKIKQWEAMFGDFGVPIKDKGEEQDELIHERSSFQGDENIEECFRVIDKVVKEVPEAKIINVTAFVGLVKRKNYDKDAVLEEIPAEIRKAKQTILKAIRRIKPINLPLRLGKDLVLEGNLAIPEAPLLREEGVSLEEIKEGDEGETTPGKVTRGKEAVSQEIEERKEEEGKTEEERPTEERVTFEGRRPTEIDTSSPGLRKSTVGGDLRKSRHFALEEVLLETQSPRGSVKGRDESYGGGGGGTTRIHYSEIMKKDKSEMTFWEKISLRLIKQIRGSGMIGDIQAGLLIGDSPFILFLNLLLVNMDKITFLVFIINFITTPNILSLVFPLSILFYAAIEYPTPPARYWKTMLVYTVLLITVKFLYQSSFFCGTPPFGFNNIFNENGGTCSNYFREPGSLALRIDFIIGITKFSGDSSYPRNQGILLGLFWDLVTFFCLVFVRFTLDSAGIWNHLRLYNSFKYVPQLGDPLPDEIKSDQHSFLEGPTQSLTEFPRASHYPHTEEGEDESKTEWTIKNFFRNIFAFNPSATGEAAIRKPGCDYYVYMAPLSLFILLYFICFYSAMVGSSRSLTEELSQSLFSASVVLTILFIITIMLLERTLYIARENVFQRDLDIDEDADADADDGPENSEKDRKWILSRRFFLKILLHYCLVVIINVFFFYNFIMSLSVENSTNNYAIIGIGYFLCTLYLYISAQQIKFGYPLVVDTRFFNSIDLPTVLMFRIYRAIPFLYEITSILDWTVSRTSLEMRQWMLLEDAYASLYLVKYDMEDRKTHKPGETRPKIERFAQGCLLVLGLIVAIILPMLLFSTLNPTSSLNNVVSGRVKIELHAISATNNYRFTLYQVENLSIQPISEEQADDIEDINPNLGEYQYEQLRYVRVPTYSETEWQISLPSLVTLNILLGEPSVTVYIAGSWTFEKQNPGNIPNSQGLNAKIMTQEERNDLSNMLASAGQETTLVINSLFPKFIGLTKLAYTNLLGADSLLDQTGFNTNIELSYVNDPRGRYWKLKSYQKDDIDTQVFGDGTEIAMVVASDKAMASILNTIGALGIIGFYVTVTYAIGRLVRTLFDGISQKVIYEEIPDPNDLMELCDAIYMARKEGDYLKEEKLYNTLIRMLRSPELLLELTGAYPKEA